MKTFRLPLSILFLFLVIQGTCFSQTWTDWKNGQSIGSFFGVALSPSATVAVGIDGRISTRNNLTGVWTIQTFTGDPDFRDVLFANGQFVTVREAGGIMTSPNGITWTTRSSGTTSDLRAVIWDGTKYVIAGQSGKILSSPDGVTWTSRNSGSSIFFNSLSFSGSRYVAVGGYGIRISDDAVTWTSPTSAPGSISFEASTWTGSRFIAGGLGFGSTPTIYSSADGSSWTLQNSTIKDNVESAVSVNGVAYITGSINGTGNGFVKRSTDNGVTWTDIYTTPNGSEYFMGLTFDGQFLVAAGFNHNVWAAALSAIPVTDPPELGIRMLTNQAIELKMKTKAGMNYQPQFSPDLISWTNLGSSISGDGLIKTVTDTVGSNPRGFYQIVISPVVIGGGNLLILEARYGANGVTNDVRSYIAAKIQNDTVTMTVGNSTLGGDPIFGVVKNLYIRYQNTSGTYEANIREGSTLRIPDASHTKIQ